MEKAMQESLRERVKQLEAENQRLAPGYGNSAPPSDLPTEPPPSLALLNRQGPPPRPPPYDDPPPPPFPAGGAPPPPPPSFEAAMKMDVDGLVAQLEQLGFPRDKARKALEATGYDPQAAADMLFGG
mmetsp:Transcript_28490/g.84041  ORF Transcript_28490/g.84041 Transcript_28490/m.84041 type:complete len:127 (+) Transcript_28490:805-1185(+)